MTWIDKLKKRYNLDSNLELVLVLVLFTILYQMLFVIYGYIIGLFKNKVWEFAWWFEKKMLSRFGIKFKESEK